MSYINLRQGDCVELLRELPDASVDCVLTDPPYASGGICLRDRQRRVSEKYQNSETKKSYPEFFGDAKDQLMGAGSTGVACLETGRCFIGMELAPAYYEISRRRLRQVQPYIMDVAMG